jgi:hypothetical protein
MTVFLATLWVAGTVWLKSGAIGGGLARVYAADVGSVLTESQRRELLERSPPRYDFRLREARAVGPIREIAITNLSLGPFKVKKLTYGKWHSFSRVEMATDENSILVWMEGPFEYREAFKQTEVLSSDGEKFMELYISGSSAQNDRTVNYLEISRWPRREREFVLRARSKLTDEVAEVRLTNPAYKYYADLRPENLPASTNLGGLEVTLSRLQEERAFFSPVVELRQNGIQAGEWETGSVVFEDATGNRSVSLADLAHEGAVMCHIEIFRRQNAIFSPDEQWHLGINVPAPGVHSLLLDARSFKSLEVQLIDIAGAGETDYTGKLPVAGRPTVDPNAQPYQTGTRRLPRLDVFIRGHPGGSIDDLLQRQSRGDEVDRFSVVGEQPHLAMLVKGASSRERIFVNTETLYGPVLKNPWNQNTATNRGDLCILPIRALPGPTDLRITVQQSKVATFVVEVPRDRISPRTLRP